MRTAFINFFYQTLFFTVQTRPTYFHRNCRLYIPFFLLKFNLCVRFVPAGHMGLRVFALCTPVAELRCCLIQIFTKKRAPLQ